MTSQVRNLWCRSQNKMGPSSKYVSSQHIVDLRQPQVAMKHHLRSVKNTCVVQLLYSEFRPLINDYFRNVSASDLFSINSLVNITQHCLLERLFLTVLLSALLILCHKLII